MKSGRDYGEMVDNVLVGMAISVILGVAGYEICRCLGFV